MKRFRNALLILLFLLFIVFVFVVAGVGFEVIIIIIDVVPRYVENSRRTGSCWSGASAAEDRGGEDVML